MNRTQEQELLWKQLHQQLEAWYDKMEFSAPAQIAFQRGNAAFAQWLDDQLAPSFLGGEVAMDGCLKSIANETDEVLRYTKLLAAHAVWEHLDAPPNDIAADLLEQGWTIERLREHLRFSMLGSSTPENIFSDAGPGPLH